MSEIKCYDVVLWVVDEATERFSPLWEIDNENLNILRQYCEIMDDILKEFDGSEFTVDVDEVNLTVSIEAVFEDITIQETAHPFYDIVKRAISVSFNQSNDGDIAVKLVFPSVWKRAV